MLSIRKLVKAKVFLPYFTFIIKMYYFKLVMKIIFEKWVVQFSRFYQNIIVIKLVINFIFFNNQLLKFYNPYYSLLVIRFIFHH